MLRGNRLYIFAIGLICSAFLVLSWRLLPHPPNFSDHKEAQAAVSGYHPGGGGCKPERLAVLSGPEAASKRDSCAEAAEQHRLQTNDLVQQTRAADAAQVAATISYEGFLVAYLGSIVSFFTLVVAIAAVWFAKRAADAAEKSVKTALETAQAELCAYIGMIDETVQFDDAEKRSGQIEFHLINRGVTPAHSAYVELTGKVVHRNGGVDTLHEGHVPAGTIPQGIPTIIKIPFTLTTEQANGIAEDRARLIMQVRLRFRDTFGGIWRYEHDIGLDKVGLRDGVVITFDCKQYREHEDANGDQSPLLPFVKPDEHGTHS